MRDKDTLLLEKAYKLIEQNVGSYMNRPNTQPTVKRIPPSQSDNINKQKLQQVLQQVDYTGFVQNLDKLLNDPKVAEILAGGHTDGAPRDEIINMVDAAPSVQALRPTQNEIDLDKSLWYPLYKQPATIGQWLQAGENIVKVGPPNNNTIITAGNPAKYIIDGHHRWSSLYCINPNAKIAAINMENIKNPFQGLKAAQIAIGATIGNIPTQSVEGTNLLDPSLTAEVFNQWYVKTASEQAKQEFQKNGINNPVEYLWNNILLMRKTSHPIKGAPERGVMPQTDTAPGWRDKLVSGKANFASPV